MHRSRRHCRLAGRRYIGAQIEAVGSNIVFAGLEQSNLSQDVSLADQITMGDLEAVRSGIPEVSQVAGTNDLPMNVTSPGKAWPASLVGVTQGFSKFASS